MSRRRGLFFTFNILGLVVLIVAAFFQTTPSFSFVRRHLFAQPDLLLVLGSLFLLRTTGAWTQIFGFGAGMALDLLSTVNYLPFGYFTIVYFLIFSLLALSSFVLSTPSFPKGVILLVLASLFKMLLISFFTLILLLPYNQKDIYTWAVFLEIVEDVVLYLVLGGLYLFYRYQRRAT